MLPPVDDLSAQDYDLTFGTNVIGHFLFLQLLYPLLDSVSHRPDSSDPARVVWVSGFANYLVPGGKLSYPTFTDGPARRNVKRGMFAMYAQSKLAQITLSAYLAKQAAEAGENVVSFAVDPGNIQSEIFRGDKAWYLRLWVCLSLASSSSAVADGSDCRNGSSCTRRPMGLSRLSMLARFRRHSNIMAR